MRPRPRARGRRAAAEGAKASARLRPTVTWRLVPHTADVGIEAEGADAGECLAEAALAMSHILTGQDPAAWTPERVEQLKVEAPDLASLAVAFLAELVWLRDTRDLLWAGGTVRVEDVGEVWRASVAMQAVRHHAATHGVGVEVKAVTYHRLEYGPGPGGRWRLRLYVDL